MKFTDLLPADFGKTIQIPILSIAISTFIPPINLLNNPLSLKGAACSFLAGWMGFIFLMSVLELIVMADTKVMRGDDSFSLLGFIGLGLLTFALALTISHFPSEFNVSSLIQNVNTIRLLALYTVAITMLRMQASLNE